MDETEVALPVPAAALAVPDVAGKSAAYLAPLRDLIALGVPRVRFPLPLRMLDALPDMIDTVADPDAGLAAWQARAGVTSARTADAIDGLLLGGAERPAEILLPPLRSLRAATPVERPALAAAFDAALTAPRRRALRRWDRRAFAEGCIARLCRAMKIEPLESESYAAAIAALGRLWGDDRHERIVTGLAEDPTVPAALARLFLRSLSLRTLEDGGTVVRETGGPGRLRRVFGGGVPAIEQSRRIVTDAGVLHCAARIGARVELSVELEAGQGRRTRLVHLSQRQGPALMAGIESQLRRAVAGPPPP